MARVKDNSAETATAKNDAKAAVDRVTGLESEITKLKTKNAELVRIAKEAFGLPPKTASQSTSSPPTEKPESKQVADQPPPKFDRTKPEVGDLKQFAKFPEEFENKCVKFNDAWVDGDFERMEGSKDLSTDVMTSDKVLIWGRNKVEFANGKAVFVFNEEFGRRFFESLEANANYKANLFCEITKQSDAFVARVFKIETIAVSGDVKDVFEEK